MGVCTFLEEPAVRRITMPYAVLNHQIATPARHWGGKAVPALVFLVFGIFAAAFPEAVWYLEIGWKQRDGKPSDLALKVNTGIGILMIVVAVLLFFV